MGANQSPSRRHWVFLVGQARADAAFWGAAVLSLTLAGCASTPPRITGGGEVVNAQSGCHAPPPNLRAAYNRPYSVKGRTYTPLRTADGYEEVGTASWYGWESGATTSMGTRFNPRDFSAASRVLPLPTCVQVTNLDNGLSALVLVNDRGPFVSSRILDLSMGAAAALGVTRTGTAQVRIVALPEGANAPLQTAMQSQPVVPNGRASTAPPGRENAKDQDVAAPGQFAQSPPAQVASTQPATAPAPIELQVLPPLTTPTTQASAPSAPMREPPSGVVQQPPMPQPALTLPGDSIASTQTASADARQPAMVQTYTPQTFVQTGAFTQEANAQIEKARLQAAGIDDVLVVPGYIRGQMFYRVQVGPLNGSPDAGLLQKLQNLGLTQYSVIQQ
ncbi:MAG: septal ring lytic transglycosylase RlpA family protein [Thiomonas sp.]